MRAEVSRRENLAAFVHGSVRWAAVVMLVMRLAYCVVASAWLASGSGVTVTESHVERRSSMISVRIRSCSVSGIPCLPVVQALLACS